MKAILVLCSLGEGFYLYRKPTSLNHHQSRSYPLREARVDFSLVKMLVMTVGSQWETEDLLGCWMRLVAGEGKIPGRRLEE